MDRRHALAALAAVLATPVLANSALAQTATQGSSGSMGSGAQRSGSMSEGMHQMGQAEMQHMQRTMAAGMVALETSKIALEKARNEDVKQFAQFETEEQTTISEILRGMMEPASTASTGQAASAGNPPGGPTATMQSAAPSGVQGQMANMQMDAKGREMIEMLRKQGAGREFDREYVQGQIQGHQELLQIQEDYIRQGRNREHLAVAKLARGQIREHLALLQDMQKELR